MSYQPATAYRLNALPAGAVGPGYQYPAENTFSIIPFRSEGGVYVAPASSGSQVMTLSVPWTGQFVESRWGGGIRIGLTCGQFLAMSRSQAISYIQVAVFSIPNTDTSFLMLPEVQSWLGRQYDAIRAACTAVPNVGTPGVGGVVQAVAVNPPISLNVAPSYPTQWAQPVMGGPGQAYYSVNVAGQLLALGLKCSQWNMIAPKDRAVYLWSRWSLISTTGAAPTNVELQLAVNRLNNYCSGVDPRIPVPGDPGPMPAGAVGPGYQYPINASQNGEPLQYARPVGAVGYATWLAQPDLWLRTWNLKCSQWQFMKPEARTNFVWSRWASISGSTAAPTTDELRAAVDALDQYCAGGYNFAGGGAPLTIAPSWPAGAVGPGYVYPSITQQAILNGDPARGAAWLSQNGITCTQWRALSLKNQYATVQRLGWLVNSMPLMRDPGSLDSAIRETLQNVGVYCYGRIQTAYGTGYYGTVPAATGFNAPAVDAKFAAVREYGIADPIYTPILGYMPGGRATRAAAQAVAPSSSSPALVALLGIALSVSLSYATSYYATKKAVQNRSRR